MTCNLAVSITKASITNQHLQALLTQDIVNQIVTVYLAQHYLSYQIELLPGKRSVFLLKDRNPRGTSFTVTIGTNRQVTVRADAWDYSTRGDQQKATDLTNQIAELLSRAADSLFARQVQIALSGLGGYQTVDTLAVDDAGVTQQATMLSIRL